jgi:23S rRNA pseudouridine2604 synthase
MDTMNEQTPPSGTAPSAFVKRVAQLCACSYAEAEQTIADGGVRVAGSVVTDPAHDIADAHIDIEPAAHPDAIEPISVLLHKPAGCTIAQALALLAPATRSAMDVSGVDLQPRHFRGHTVLLPLDDASSGLLVLTQDPRVRRRLAEDALEQEFVVEVEGERGPYVLGQLLRAAPYLGKTREPFKVSWQSETRLRFAIKEPQLGELHYVCAQGALRIVAMRRLRIGRIALARLPLGEWRALGEGEKF